MWRGVAASVWPLAAISVWSRRSLAQLRTRRYHRQVCRCSSTVEPWFCKPVVVGSIPIAGSRVEVGPGSVGARPLCSLSCRGGNKSTQARPSSGRLVLPSMCRNRGIATPGRVEAVDTASCRSYYFPACMRDCRMHEAPSVRAYGTLALPARSCGWFEN